MGTETPAVCSHGSLRRSCEICERDAEIERLRAERDEAIAAARHLKNLVTSPLTEEDKEWARETMSDTNLARMPRDLATILRTEARNQRTPPIDYAVAEDGGRMVVRQEPDIAMAELLEEAATALAAERAAREKAERERVEAFQNYVDANEALIDAESVIRDFLSWFSDKPDGGQAKLINGFPGFGLIIAARRVLDICRAVAKGARGQQENAER